MLIFSPRRSTAAQRCYSKFRTRIWRGIHRTKGSPGHTRFTTPRKKNRGNDWTRLIQGVDPVVLTSALVSSVDEGVVKAGVKALGSACAALSAFLVKYCYVCSKWKRYCTFSMSQVYRESNNVFLPYHEEPILRVFGKTMHVQEKWMRDALQRRKEKGTLRELRTAEGDRCFVDFTSNDYLGLGRSNDLWLAVEIEEAKAREVRFCNVRESHLSPRPDSQMMC